MAFLDLLFSHIRTEFKEISLPHSMKKSSEKIYLGLIFWIFFFFFFFFFFQNSNWFLQCQHFFTTRCYFLCMSSVSILEYILDNIWVAFESRSLEKIYIDFSSNAFPIDTLWVSYIHFLPKIFFMIKLT